MQNHVYLQQSSVGERFTVTIKKKKMMMMMMMMMGLLGFWEV